jgi:hypothetical protein
VAGNPGYLTEVTSVDKRSDLLLVVQLFNTTTPRKGSARQKVWYDDHPGSKMRHPKAVDKEEEWNEYWTPVLVSNKRNARYKPWVEEAALADFIPIVLDLKPDGPGYLNLPKKFHDKYVLGVRPARPLPLPKEEHRDLSWFVDSTTGHPPVDNTKPVTKPKAPPEAPNVLVAPNDPPETRLRCIVSPVMTTKAKTSSRIQIASPWSRPSEPFPSSSKEPELLWSSSRPRPRTPRVSRRANVRNRKR